MHSIPWYIALLISFPQTILIIEFGFRLFNIQLKIKDVFLLSSIIAVICYVLRPLVVPYAVNAIILIICLSFLSSFICGIRLRYCFISVILGVIIYGVLETALIPIIIKILGISMKVITVSARYNLICFIPIFICAVILLSFTIKKIL